MIIILSLNKDKKQAIYNNIDIDYKIYNNFLYNILISIFWIYSVNPSLHLRQFISDNIPFVEQVSQASYLQSNFY